MIGAVVLFILFIVLIFCIFFNSNNFQGGGQGSYLMKNNIKHIRKDVKNKKRFFNPNFEDEG